MNLIKGPWRELLDSALLVAAAALAVGAVVMLYDVNKELATSQNMYHDNLSSFSVRAEFDLASLISEINEFIQEESPLYRVQERYEILIGRFVHYETAYLAQFSESGSNIKENIGDLKVELLDLEEAVYALQADSPKQAIGIRDSLKGFRSSLAELSNLTIQKQIIQHQKIDGSFARSVRIGTLVLASTLILCALTIGRFWYGLRLKTRFNEELEAKIQARTQDLQLSNNELKSQITQRKRTERKLAEREQQIHRVQKMEAVGRITAGVAHDFNNLLAVIMGNVELAISSNDKKSKKFLDNALAASVMGSQLTRKLLAFGRRSPLKPEVINLNQIISDLDDLFSHTISEKNTLEYLLAQDIKPISVDQSLLENVLLNLIINARDALPSGGAITIETNNVVLENDHAMGDGRVLPAGDCVQISVSDDGSGMSAEVLDQAIEPFFSTKPESEGSGLGLSMAYGFVQQSSGQIRVSSKLGLGTTVSMVFPASSTVSNTSKPASLKNYAALERTRKILVAEDSEAVRDMVLEQLQLLGFETVEAVSGQQAIEIIMADKSIDLLLTDVVMPGSLQGPELAEKALLQNPDLRIVFMSGYPKGMDQSANSPTSKFSKLTKPISLSTLAQTLNNEFETERQPVNPMHTSSIS